MKNDLLYALIAFGIIVILGVISIGAIFFFFSEFVALVSIGTLGLGLGVLGITVLIGLIFGVVSVFYIIYQFIKNYFEPKKEEKFEEYTIDRIKIAK